MLSKQGAPPVATAKAVPAFRQYLIPRAALLMPNLPEATALCGFPVDSVSRWNWPDRRCSTRAPEAVLIKGGHLEGDPVDLSFYQEVTVCFRLIDRHPAHPRYRSALIRRR